MWRIAALVKYEVMSKILIHTRTPSSFFLVDDFNNVDYSDDGRSSFLNRGIFYITYY